MTSLARFVIDEALVCDHLNDSYWAVLSCKTVCFFNNLQNERTTFFACDCTVSWKSEMVLYSYLFHEISNQNESLCFIAPLQLLTLLTSCYIGRLSHEVSQGPRR